MECGKKTEYICIGAGYRRFCSQSCKIKSPLVHEKSKQTKMDRYGDPNYNNIEKLQITCLERYGTRHATSSEQIKNKVKKTWDSKSDHQKKEFRKNHSNIWKQKSQDEKREIVNKVKKTKQERYGDPNYNNMEKVRKTCLEKFGVDNTFKSEEIKKKIRQSCLEKYNVEHPAQNENILQKMMNTCSVKYGAPHYTQTDEFKKINSKNRINKTIKDNDNILGYLIDNDEIIYTYQCPHTDCQLCKEKSFKSTAGHYAIRKNQGTEVCTNIFPIQHDRNTGTYIEIFIRNILDSLNIQYETNNREILNGKELDIYIPKKKLAIECNGIYWHSLKEPDFHYRKWKNCKDQGIQLLTIWEDQIINKPDIIKNIIASRLNIYNEHVYARQCDIRYVSSKESIEFLQSYHLQGPINGSIRLGLYRKDELMGIMVFGRSRKSLGSNAKNNTWELYRYCNKQGVQIVGGASRLFNHFLKEHPNCIIESFSSNDISMGDIYQMLKFELQHEQKGSYWYIDKKMQRYHRYTFRKDVLIRNGADSTKTEFQITKSMGLFRIYDSGQQKWIYKNMMSEHL